MGKETLSQKEAKAIADEANALMSLCNTRIKTSCADFIEKVSKVWEDQNAIDYFREFKASIEGFIDELSHNNGVFISTVQSIANYYAEVGNMAKIALSPIGLIGEILITKIKDHFDDGDEFGFVNPENGAEQVMDAFETLKKQLNQIALDTVSKIKSINAFGNQEVQLQVAASAGKLVEILENHIKEADKQIRGYVDSTAKQSYGLK